jgi:hypothetical protein
MNRISNDDFPPPPRRVGIAGALGAGALAMLALDVGLELQTAPAAPVAAAVTATAHVQPSNLRTVSYYPEQLAALTSLSTFQPVADAGVAEDSFADGAMKPPAQTMAPGEVKPLRHAETAAKSAPAASALPETGADAKTGAAQAAAPPLDRSVKLFGVTAPGADLVASLNDHAARWGAAVWGLGGKVSGMWR